MYTKIKGFRRFLGLVLLLSFLSSPSVLMASEEHHGEKVEKFNAGKLILDHIGDSHGWHLFGNVELPLPVILYSSAKGLEVFSSARFEHGHAIYKGYKIHEKQIVSVNEDGSVNEEASAGIWDLSITKNVAALLISVFLLCIIFITVAKSFDKRKGMAPKGIQSWMEPLIIFVRDDIAKASIGPKYERFMPFLLTVFFFIWINNLLGLVPFFPGGANLTGNIAVTLTLAVFTFVITSFSANSNYWRHVFAMPGVPVWVLFLLTPIEILGVFLRPFVLMVRLFANITAGHIIILSFISLIFIFGDMSPVMGYSASPVSLLFALFMGTLELLVAFLQAYVFTLLSAIYFGSAVEEHHHPEHDTAKAH